MRDRGAGPQFVAFTIQRTSEGFVFNLSGLKFLLISHYGFLLLQFLIVVNCGRSKPDRLTLVVLGFISGRYDSYARSTE
jgi:hypothetical protein